MDLIRDYNAYWEYRDKRIDGWFLMGSIWPTVIMCVLYVLFSKVLGPLYMKNRNPIEMKGLMSAYNILQVVCCLWMLIKLWMNGWGTYFNHLCQPVDKNPDPNSPAMIMASALYWFYMSKLLDFVDTFFFVIRKKNNQITALHVIHHGIMPIYTWGMVRWVPGGQESFGALINTFIHVLMYSYYFLSALGPAVQPYLWWKRYLTQAQICQFFIILFKCLLVSSGLVSCDYPWQWSFITGLMMILFIALFLNFYMTAYAKAKTKRN